MKFTDTNTTVSDHAVHVSVVTVNGKTMTPVMFRQLPKKPLLDASDARMLGVPWGRVNYYWGSCHRDHLHIIWIDRDGEISRDCVYRTPARGAEITPTWLSQYTILEELPQLYIDGVHEEGLVR